MLTIKKTHGIILFVSDREKSKTDNMRECWNWQTGMTKDHVSTDVRVQVPFPASQKSSKLKCFELFLLNNKEESTLRFELKICLHSS